MNDAQWTAEDLASMGIGEHELRSRLKGGTLVCLRRGHYAPAASDSPEGRHLRLIRATTQDVTDSNVFSHTSAGVIHGLPVPSDALNVATMTRVTPGHGDGSSNLRVRNTRLAGDEITTVVGVRVTTLERTVCDLARLSPFEWGVAAADAALRLGVSCEGLMQQLDRHPRRHGVKRARHVLRFADGRSESPAESLSRAQMARWGIPTPTLQFEIFDREGEFIGRSDFAWPDLGLVGEVDGRVKYADLLKPGQTVDDVVMDEKRREQRIRQCGFWVVRWGWAEAVSGVRLAAVLNDGFRNALPRRG